MEELVRVEKVYNEDGEKMRVYSLITEQANDYLLEMLEKEQGPVPVAENKRKTKENNNKQLIFRRLHYFNILSF